MFAVENNDQGDGKAPTTTIKDPQKLASQK